MAPFHTVICDMLGIRYPILQGAMQGGGGAELVAAVSEAGGLGILPTFGGTEEKLRQDIVAVRARTDRPFAVNITPMGRGFTDSRVAIILEERVPIATTGRADPGERAIRRMKDSGVTVLSVIPTVDHAKRMADEGVDAVIASGMEAGGHVGTIATLPLVPQVVDALDIPVLAAGGIGDARGFLAAFALGAVGVQIGTAFMATTQSDLNDWGKARLLAMRETDTIVSKARTGAPVRCFASPELIAYEDARLAGAPPAALKALALAARDDRNAPVATRRQVTVGQIAGMLTRIAPVGAVIETIIADAAALAGALHDRAAGRT